MTNYGAYTPSEEVFLSMCNFTHNQKYAVTDRLWAWDEHIEQIIGYGVQLCYDLDEQQVAYALENIDRFQTLDDWRAFIPQFSDEIKAHGAFRDSVAFAEWAWDYLDNYLKKTQEELDFEQIVEIGARLRAQREEQC